MTLEEFNRSLTNKVEDDPAYVRKLVELMTKLDVTQLYNRGLRAQSTGKKYGVQMLSEMCRLLDDDPHEISEKGLGEGLITSIDKVRQDIEENDYDEGRLYSEYMSLISIIAVLPLGFV